jgi:hypothetical protein
LLGRPLSIGRYDATCLLLWDLVGCLLLIPLLLCKRLAPLLRARAGLLCPRPSLMLLHGRSLVGRIGRQTAAITAASPRLPWLLLDWFLLRLALLRCAAAPGAPRALLDGIHAGAGLDRQQPCKLQRSDQSGDYPTIFNAAARGQIRNHAGRVRCDSLHAC